MHTCQGWEELTPGELLPRTPALHPEVSAPEWLDSHLPPTLEFREVGCEYTPTLAMMQALLLTPPPIHSAGPLWGCSQGSGARSTEEAPGCGRRRKRGTVALPIFPEEMSNPLLGSYTSPSEEVALSGDQPRALHNRQPPPALHSGHGRIWGLAKAFDEHLYPV